MAGLDVFEHAVAAEDADEHGGVAAHFGVAAEEAVDVVEDLHRIGAHGHAGKAPCSMVVSSAAPRPLPLTSAMRNRGAVFAHRNHIEVVAAHFSGRDNARR